MNARVAALLMLSLFAGMAQAQDAMVSDYPLASYDNPQPAVDTLQPGEFEWAVDPASVKGPLLIVVSLADQRAWVFRNGERVATSTVSTGMVGRETPTGVFPILEKQKVHRSNRYNDAPMPFMQRLTWYGVAMHAGHNPGYPASHGCVRLPKQFARQLFDITRRDETVVISPDGRTESLLAVGLPEWQALQVGQTHENLLPLPSSIPDERALTTSDPAFESGNGSTVMAD